MVFKKIYKLVLFSFLGPFVVTFFVCLFALLMHFLWKYIDDMAGKGLDMFVVAELLFYASAHFVPLALPLAVLLSSIMAFGNLSERSELIALKTAGVSLIRAMVPLFVTVFFLSLAALYFTNYVLPTANLKFGALLWDVRQKKPSLDIREGIFYSGLDGYIIRANERDDNTNVLHDVLIYDHSKSAGNQIVTRAKEAEMFTTPDERWLVMRLTDGIRYEEMEEDRKGNKTNPHSRLKFESYEIRFDLSGFQMKRTDEDLFKGHHQMLTIRQLKTSLDSMNLNLLVKQKLIHDFVKPSFYILHDTTFFEHTDPKAADLNPEIALIENIEPRFRNNVINRSITHSRNVRRNLEMHSSEISILNQRISRFGVEWHRKFTLSFACIVLFLIGAPLGAIIRKGGLGMPTVIAVILFIIFHILSITFEKFARQQLIDPFLGMWIPVFILIPIGIFLTYKANVDSPILNKDAFVTYVKRLFKK